MKMKMWRCEVCGYLHEGDEPPDFCPKCGMPKDRFKLLDDEEAEMMRDAKATKAKYKEILEMLNMITNLADEGVALDLDEGCNAIFNKTKEDLASIRKMISDELNKHAHECIWVKVASDGEMP